MSYDPDRYEVDDRPAFKHTGFGIASFIISLAVGFLDFVLVAIAGVLEATTPGGMDEESAGAILLGLSLFGLAFVNLIGIGLGFAGIFQARRNKTFAVLGIVIGLLTLVTMGLLAVLGIMAD
jgi:hypothetical protein